MTTCDELLDRWNSCLGGQILVDASHPLKMYLNINDKGHRELLVPVKKQITSFRPTEAIGINNYRQGSGYLFSIELQSETLVQEYGCLCFDLIESSRSGHTAEESCTQFFETFKKWYSLWMTAKSGILSLSEIRGLMGELKYILDVIEAKDDTAACVSAWTTHKDASRDFIYDTTWDEIKAITTSGDYVTISSLEQLEHDSDGKLIVYRLDRADSLHEECTCTLNSLVNEIKEKMELQVVTELTRKLLAKGYSYNQAYDNYIFKFGKKSIYNVNDTFPRIGKSLVPDAVCAARYDIMLSLIENWRES